MPYFYLTGSGSVAGLLILVKEPYQSSKGRARYKAKTSWSSPPSPRLDTGASYPKVAEMEVPSEVGDPSYPYEQTSTGSSGCLYVYRGLDFPLCHYLVQHICREQEHIQVSYSVESDLAALTTETKERSKIRPKSRRFSHRNKRWPVARPSPKKNFLGEARKHSCAPLHSPSILYKLLVPSAST